MDLPQFCDIDKQYAKHRHNIELRNQAGRTQNNQGTQNLGTQNIQGTQNLDTQNQGTQKIRGTQNIQGTQNNQGTQNILLRFIFFQLTEKSFLEMILYFEVNVVVHEFSV